MASWFQPSTTEAALRATRWFVLGVVALASGGLALFAPERRPLALALAGWCAAVCLMGTARPAPEGQRAGAAVLVHPGVLRRLGVVVFAAPALVGTAFGALRGDRGAALMLAIFSALTMSLLVAAHPRFRVGTVAIEQLGVSGRTSRRIAWADLARVERRGIRNGWALVLVGRDRACLVVPEWLHGVGDLAAAMLARAPAEALHAQPGVRAELDRLAARVRREPARPT